MHSHSVGVHADLEGSQKKWIIGAVAIAVVLHLLVAWAMGWYKIPGLELPDSHSEIPSPFTVKQIEINPDALNPRQQDTISQLPAADPSANPSQFNLDPAVVDKVLQTPQPTLTTPTVPEASKVIAATDLSQGLPYTESDAAKVTAEIAKVEPSATSSSPLASSKLAQELITANAGVAQSGVPAGKITGGNGNAGQLPGFAQLAPTFHPSDPNLTKLPEPVLLRLPSDVLFDFDSAQLKPEADSLLSHAVQLVTKYPQADVQIDGYSDSVGRADYNLALSQQRAEAVQAWLQAHTAAGSYKYRSHGHGSANYVVSPQGSIEQQQPNRRVEIVIQALKP